MSKDEDVLADAKEEFERAVDHEHDNRATALEDTRFALLEEQWPDHVRKQREKEGRPCLTIPKLGQFIRQVVNDARQNKPAIKVHPADSKADVQTAQIYNGLIRHIEVSSKAPIAYDTALEHATAGGFGYFRIVTKYACDDTFDLDLAIERIANPFSVYGDPYSTAADSADWNTAFVVDRLPTAEFERRYKGAEKVDWQESYEQLDAPWREDDTTLIAEWWRREKVKKTIVLLSDQQVMAEDLYKERKAELDAAGVTVVTSREIQSHKVVQRLLTGAEVLETNDWAGQYIPIVPVYGHEINVEGRRYFRALIHGAIDAQRMFNYWRTTTTELVALSPKAPYIGPKGSFDTDAAKWASANTETHAFIEYDDKGTPPQRQPFASIPAGALQEALNASDDMKAVVGMYDASLGARSNETSGKAIMARQREGDISTFHFIDNLARGIEHAGRILIDLIPKVYTGERMVRVLGQDNAATTIQLGKPVPVMGPNGQPVMDQSGAPLTRIYDLGAGKYDLTVSTGPSFTTRREEAVFEMTEAVRAFPAAAPVIIPLIAKNSDWPQADEIGQKLEALAAQAAQGEGGKTDPAQVQMEAEIARGELAIKSQELKLKAYEAETKRMEMLWKLEEQKRQALNPSPQPQPRAN